jgi:Flp pilus assembly protein TadG
MLPRCRHYVLRFHRDQRGLSAVEFALLLPFMITLYLGGVEVSQAISIDRKVTLTARTVADLVARSSSLTQAEMTNILNAATAVSAPYASADIKVKVSQILIKANGTATIHWSAATNNTTKRSAGETVTVPEALKVAGKDSYLIWGEVEYGYKPAIGYVLTGTLNLTDQIYMRPRLSEKVEAPT